MADQRDHAAAETQDDGGKAGQDSTGKAKQRVQTWTSEEPNPSCGARHEEKGKETGFVDKQQPGPCSQMGGIKGGAKKRQRREEGGRRSSRTSLMMQRVGLASDERL